MRRITFLIPAVVLAIAVLLSSIFVVDERQRRWCCSSVRSAR
jgi:regulator of protease activity HflC (stomatin/prohibitin superfamily)